MPASIPRRRMFRRDTAEVGVGTLIIFIAMVLVAAVAAAVIISTSGSLQQRAMQTGKEATAEVSSNLRVIGVYGERADAISDISTLTVGLTLAAGGEPLDLSDSVIRYSDGGEPVLYKFDDATTPFTLDWIRGEGTGNVIYPGDLVEIQIGIADELASGTDFQLQFIHLTGAPHTLEIKTPSSYGNVLYFGLQ